MYPSASEGADAAPGGEGVLSLFAELLASCLKDGRAAAGECLREDTPAMATQEGIPAATALQQAVGLGSERTSQATWPQGDMRALGTHRRRSLFPRAKNVTQMGFRP